MLILVKTTGIGFTYNFNQLGAYTARLDPPTDGRSAFWSPNGDKAYVGDGQNVEEYTMSTNWDLSTASLTYTWAASAWLTGLAFKSDGTKMYLFNSSSYAIRTYSLSTPWDLSTLPASWASYDSQQSLGGTFDTNPAGLNFSADGSMMYVAGDTNQSMFKWTLSTPWDVTTVGSSTSRNVGTDGFLHPRYVFWNADGTKGYLIDDSTPDKIATYNLSTPYDFATATYSSSAWDIPTEVGNNAKCAYWGDSGSKLYIQDSGTNAWMYEYPIT
jgi:hypothetical protein